ncbi:MAG: hypothetical protein JNJ65_10500 [Cyclobacteriaceae bacterium]|jgi:hypothetical protein|nr:hypothetical protein [Cyclobacteriaceae bacterium]
MGITKNCSRFLVYARAKGVSYERAIMLGRQVLYVNKDEFIDQIKHYSVASSEMAMSLPFEKFAEPLFSILGATRIDSIDYSDYEGASIIHDLNQPLPQFLQKKYSIVFDGGTLEHVFNFPQAIKNCMDMLEVGGHFLSITPTNNLCGHGFYQFSPELFFSVFSEKHGFVIKLLAMGVEQDAEGITEWYQVNDPKTVKRRVTLRNSQPTHIMIIAQKITDTENISLQPIQSDYEMVWEVFSSQKNDIPIKHERKVIYYYRKYMPSFLKQVVRKFVGSSEVHRDLTGLGIVNPDFFKKMEV